MKPPVSLEETHSDAIAASLVVLFSKTRAKLRTGGYPVTSTTKNGHKRVLWVKKAHLVLVRSRKRASNQLVMGKNQ
jgi:hypothetical protein